MYCNKCGRVLEDGTIFCANCGTKIENDLNINGENKLNQTNLNIQASNQNYENFNTLNSVNNVLEQRKKNKKSIFKIFLLIAVIIVVVIILFLGIFYLISANSNKLVCKSGYGDITIMYNESEITGYVSSGISYDLDGQKEYARRVGIPAYIEEFENWFFLNTSGYCTIED